MTSEMSGLTGYDDRAHVGGRIRQARRELGLTQAELATRIGVSLGALDRFESGKADPSGKLERIAEVTERPVAWYTSVDAYDVGGGLYESGLPAELRKRLAASSGRRAPTDAELAEPGSAVGALTPQAPEGAPPEPVAPSEHSVRRAQPADELERVNANQQALITEIVHKYLDTLPDLVAASHLDRLQAAGFENITFAWAGSLEAQRPHYYRLQGPTFLMEHDNSRNRGTHIHSVWRDFAEDFGQSF